MTERIELDKTHIGKRIRVAMVERDLSTAEVAQRLGITTTSVTLYKKGQIFDVRQLYKLAGIFGMSLDELLGTSL